MSDEELPDGGYSNRAHVGAYRKGFKAALAGKPCACPYIDKRGWRGQLTFSRSFITAWYSGFDAGYFAQKARMRRANQT